MTVVPLQHPTTQRAPGASRQRVVAALDIGSTKISCLIASASRNSHSGHVDLRVKGFGTTAARGIRSGAVTNIEEAEKAIRLAVDAAERMAGTAVDTVQVGVSGGRPQSSRFSASLKIDSAVVRQSDIDQVVSLALAKAVVGTRTILHLTPLRFVLDGIESDNAPVGMHGLKLSVDVSLITIETPFLRNLSEAIDRSHLSVAGFVPAAYAAGTGCLADDEKSLGAVLIDMGSSVTSVGIFKNGRLFRAESVPIGGQHITNDIARALCTPVPQAERLKSLYGGLLTFGKDEQELIPVQRVGETGIDSLHHIPRAQLTAIIRPRMEEILELVGEKISTGNTPDSSFRRAVLTGGGASLPGLRELSRSVLGLETRIGHISQSLGLPDALRHPASAVATGLLMYALDPDAKLVMPVQAAVAIERQQMSYVRRVGRWLAESF
jgi:cell division protein FtsA